MRNLVSVQRIEKIEPIEGADFIEKAKVLGWTLVVKKGEFKVGDLCVYHEIDSVLPDHPVYDFMKGPSGNAKNLRLRTKKLRGVISQGLALPLRILDEFACDTTSVALKVGDDVTDVVGVTKYEPPAQLRFGNFRCDFPFYVPRTDETRIQSIPEIIREIVGVKCYISVKLDGMSGTYIHRDGDFHVCSRSRSLRDGVAEGLSDKDDAWWRIAKKYKLQDGLSLQGNYAIQGEICGPGIQKNRLGLKEIEFFLFDVYDIDEQTYCDLPVILQAAKTIGCPTVPIEKLIVINETVTLEDFLCMAEGKYEGDKPKGNEGKYEGTKNEREGIVIRPVETRYSEVLKSRLSFKVVSNKFLLKTKDQE